MMFYIVMALYLLLFGAFFGMIYAWYTGTTATFSGMTATGIIGAITGYLVNLYTNGINLLYYVILSTSTGVFLMFSMSALIFVFIINALSDLTKDRPIRLVK